MTRRRNGKGIAPGRTATTSGGKKRKTEEKKRKRTEEGSQEGMRGQGKRDNNGSPYRNREQKCEEEDKVSDMGPKSDGGEGNTQSAAAQTKEKVLIRNPRLRQIKP